LWNWKHLETSAVIKCVWKQGGYLNNTYMTGIALSHIDNSMREIVSSCIIF